MKYKTVRGYQLEEGGGITCAMEDYIEMIARLSKEKGFVRVTELSDALDVRDSSVTKMAQKLKSKGLVTYAKYGSMELTQEGWDLGKFFLQRHEEIVKLLTNLGVKDNVVKETELIEHQISEKTLEAIKRFNELLESDPEILAKLNQEKDSF